MSRIRINPDEVDAVAKEFQAIREQSQQIINSLSWGRGSIHRFWGHLPNKWKAA